MLGLSSKSSASDIAKGYDKRIKYLFEHFSKKIAIMGIGEDGHTASLPAGTHNLGLITNNYVAAIKDFPGEFGERITLTFKALSEMDTLIVLVFGPAKRNVLNLMFDPSAGSGQEDIEEIPARFYTLPETTKKTILITDQKV
jgi:6-phosphogluconolactonase/glucosamine-6-phosphate isomerase/deaminase